MPSPALALRLLLWNRVASRQGNVQAQAAGGAHNAHMVQDWAATHAARVHRTRVHGGRPSRTLARYTRRAHAACMQGTNQCEEKVRLET